MKAIIRGIRYDTESAIELGSAESRGYSYTDFHHWSEALYRTKRSGRFFLAGEGGALSRYSRSYGNNGSIGGEAIIPLTKEQAFEWAQEHMPAEDVEQHFADQIEEA